MSSNLAKLMLYLFIGLAAAFIDFSVFQFMRRGLGFQLLLANTSAVCCGVVFSFFANRNFNFKVFDRVSSRFVRFAIVACAGLAISNALVYALTLFYLQDSVAKVASIVIVGGCQFIVNYLWTFSIGPYPTELFAKVGDG